MSIIMNVNDVMMKLLKDGDSCIYNLNYGAGMVGWCPGAFISGNMQPLDYEKASSSGVFYGSEYLDTIFDAVAESDEAIFNAMGL